MDPVDQAIEVLNRIHKTDPTVLPELISYRVECNLELADDPTVQVGREKTHGVVYKVGLLGIINGLFGVDENGWGFIYANFEKDELIDFSRKPKE